MSSSARSAIQQEKVRRTRSLIGQQQAKPMSMTKLLSSEHRRLRNGIKKEEYICEAIPTFVEKKKPQLSNYKGSRPAELFRKDLITLMTSALSEGETAETALVITDPWRQEWNEAVQVPVEPLSLPNVNTRRCQSLAPASAYNHNKTYITTTKKRTSTEGNRTKNSNDPRYDLDEMDSRWLNMVNAKRKTAGSDQLSELDLERLITMLEDRCHQNLLTAAQCNTGTVKSGREFDEDAVCDVCLSGESSSDDEIVFCDGCDVCVHESCYGIRHLPLADEQWHCRACQLSPHQLPQCFLCPNPGGAIKCTKTGTRWAHVSCVLWIPEVRFGDVKAMEPVSHLNDVPEERWLLRCSICGLKKGACIQCSMRNCHAAYHVTCAQRNNQAMEMQTDANLPDGISLISYCQRHSESVGDGMKKLQRSPQGVRHFKERTAQLQNRFYCRVDQDKIATEMEIDLDQVRDVYEYWKMKRAQNGGRALLLPIDDAQSGTDLERRHGNDLLAGAQQLLQLRQNLEKARNLCYMIERREKLKARLMASTESLSMRIIQVLEGNTERLSAREMARYALYLHPDVDTPPNSPEKGIDKPSLTPVKVSLKPILPACAGGCDRSSRKRKKILSMPRRRVHLREREWRRTRS